jgi:polyisoprenoid-binding protein YceI
MNPLRFHAVRGAAALLAACALSPAALAEPATYRVDPDHTYPSFEADHLGGLSVWRGKLNHTTGWVTLDKAAGTGSVDIAVDLDSIDFGQDVLNRWARGDQFFDVEKYPHARLQGTLGAFRNGVPGEVRGQLTLHGVTQPLVLSILSFKCMPHPLLKRELCGADAFGTFQRDAYGLAAGKDYGFRMDVTLRIQVEALREP